MMNFVPQPLPINQESLVLAVAVLGPVGVLAGVGFAVYAWVEMKKEDKRQGNIENESRKDAKNDKEN